MSLHPVNALDHAIDEYADYLRTEFRAKDLKLRAALEAELDEPRFPAQEPFYQAHRPVKSGQRWRELPIDALVADAYGLSRDQYAHVLSTFSHASYRKAPELCLARFDELKRLGLDKFTRKYDPYWDIPLNENLPQPVIDLPVPGEATDHGPRTTDETASDFRLTGAPKAKRGRKRR